MAHNISNNRRRAEAMGAALEQFSGWHFDIQCANCGERKSVAVADLARRFGALTVKEVVGRLRCGIPRCGGRPSSLALRRGGYRIALLGIGAHR